MNTVLFAFFWGIIIFIGYGVIYLYLFLDDGKGKRMRWWNQGDYHKSELLYTMCRLGLISYWINPKNGEMFSGATGFSPREYKERYG